MLPYLFVVFALVFRFIPHPMAFTPVGAALLFFGARAERRRLWIPLALLAASDVILTTLVYRYPFSWDHFVTWAWYAAILWLGTTLKQNAGAFRIMGSAIAGSVAFYVVSNFAVWAAWDMYPRTVAGLMTSYDAGFPFFRRAITGDMLFTAAMFATPFAIAAISERLHKAGDHTAAA
jgi:hypothetical protein